MSTTEDRDRPSPAKVLMAAEVIAPGGGPAGYTFNLLEGFRERAREDDPISVSGEGAVATERYRGTGEARHESAPVAAARRVISRLPHPVLYRMLSRLRWMTSARDTAHRRAYAGSDVIVFQGYQPSVRMAWAKRHGKTVLYMPHSPSPTADEERMIELARAGRSSAARYRFLRWDENRLFALSDLVVFASPGAAQQYEQAFPAGLRQAERRYVLSGVGQPAPRRPESHRAHDASRVVLFAGRYVHHKGYDLFLDAAVAAQEMGVRAEFATLGTGPDARRSEAVTDLGWSEEPASELRDASLVVIPNRIAYFDLLPLEAAALGKPLVLTRVGGNVDQLDALPATVGADVDARSIARAVDEALQRLDADPEFGAGNRRAYQELFTPARLADRWSTVLREAIAQHSS